MTRSFLNMPRRKINIFKIGSIGASNISLTIEGYSTSYQCNRDKYRFRLKNVEEEKEVIKYLKDKGFEIALIEDSSDYTVKISKSNKEKS